MPRLVAANFTGIGTFRTVWGDIFKGRWKLGKPHDVIGLLFANADNKELGVRAGDTLEGAWSEGKPTGVHSRTVRDGNEGQYKVVFGDDGQLQHSAINYVLYKARRINSIQIHPSSSGHNLVCLLYAEGSSSSVFYIDLTKETIQLMPDMPWFHVMVVFLKRRHVESESNSVAVVYISEITRSDVCSLCQKTNDVFYSCIKCDMVSEHFCCVCIIHFW